MTQIEACMSEGCDRAIRSRGLCSSCYTTYAKQVRQRKTTWQALEDAKLALPTQPYLGPARRSLAKAMKRKDEILSERAQARAKAKS